MPKTKSKILPVLPIKNTVLFPYIHMPFSVGRPTSVAALEAALTTEEKEITKDDKQVTFVLKVDPKCATGSSKNLFCAVDVLQNGAVIPHSIASGGILRVTPEKKEATHVAAAEKKK